MKNLEDFNKKKLYDRIISLESLIRDMRITIVSLREELKQLENKIEESGI